MNRETRGVSWARCWCGASYQWTPDVELANGHRMSCGREECEPRDEDDDQ